MKSAWRCWKAPRKYGRHNYRRIGVRASVYYDAALRHLMAFWEGEDIDPDSGLPHIVKAIATMVVLRDGQINELWEDDRPPALPSGWIDELNARAGEIIDRYPDAPEPHTEDQGSMVDLGEEPADPDAATDVTPEDVAAVLDLD